MMELTNSGTAGKGISIGGLERVGRIHYIVPADPNQMNKTLTSLSRRRR